MPSSSQPSAVRVAVPTGAATAGQRKSPSPKSSACAFSGNQEATCSACPEGRQYSYSHPEEPQPAESSVTTRENVGRSHS